MISEKERFLGNIVKIVDFIFLLFAFPIAYFIDEFVRLIVGMSEKAYAESATWDGFIFFAGQYWALLIGFPLIWMGVFYLNGIHRELHTRSFGKTVWLVFTSSIWAAVASGSYVFILKLELTSRLFFVAYAVAAFLLIILKQKLFLYVLAKAHARGYNQENLLIVGTGPRALEFIHTVKESSKWGLNIVGLIDDEHGLYGKEFEGYRVLGRIQDIGFIVNRIVIDRVIFVVPRLWLHRIENAILECEKAGVPTSISLDLYNLYISRARQTDFNGFPLLEFQTFYAKEWQLFLKRTIDLTCSIFAIFFFSPLIMIVAFLIRLTSKGPVFFKQTRVGLQGRRFTLYKFRSMIVNAEEKKNELLQQNEMDGPVFKMKRDPRITPIGHFLRKTSIDELPQFFNVLKGDMSIVGPRPPLLNEVAEYEIWHRRRLSLKPGITCIWQVSGRNKVSFDQWMKMDLDYIDRWSLFLDFKILLRTFFVVLVGYGAE
jgi:exopolysaccharide biosynthesis polyprenyl glycosylphosphotransferase